jgi:hypothetical protein
VTDTPTTTRVVDEPEVPMARRTDLTKFQPRPVRGPKIREGKQWDEENSDHSPNVGSYAVQAAAGMVDLAVELTLAAGRVPIQRHIDWAANRLLEAADDIQAGVRADGRADRMDTSHARARGVLRTVLTFIPFPIDGATDVGIVPPARADRVHQWHADAVNAGIALLRIAIKRSGIDWRNA